MLLEHVGERGNQPRVELDRDHVGTARVERERERTETRPDLDHPNAGTDPGVPDDRARDVRIEQEMLSERSARGDPVPVREIPELRRSEPPGPTS